MKLTALDKICAILAELLGTFLLLFIGCMACQDKFGAPPPMLHIALAFGLAIMVGAQVSERYSVPYLCYKSFH